LGVAVLDEATRQTEFGGESAGGRRPLSGAEPARTDRVAELPLQLGAELLATVPVDGQQQVG